MLRQGHFLCHLLEILRKATKHLSGEAVGNPISAARALTSHRNVRCRIALPWQGSVTPANIIDYFRIEVLTAVVMKSTVFWGITLCNPLKANRRFGGTCRLHIQGRRISQARNQRDYLLHAGFLHGVFCDPEYGSDMFLRNVGWLSTDYTALCPRGYHSF
jgi:hypothetical protein